HRRRNQPQSAGFGADRRDGIDAGAGTWAGAPGGDGAAALGRHQPGARAPRLPGRNRARRGPEAAGRLVARPAPMTDLESELAQTGWAVADLPNPAPVLQARDHLLASLRRG